MTFASKSSALRSKLRKLDTSFEWSLDTFRKWLLDSRVKGTDLLWFCCYCRAPISIESLSVDHEIARAMGGLSTVENFLICCKKCNARKGALSGETWRRLLAFVDSLVREEQAFFWQKYSAVPNFYRARPKVQATSTIESQGED